MASQLRGVILKYRRFEELPAWNSAIELALGVYELSSTGCFQGYGGLRNQVERAALSVSNNIAEGFERGTHEELLTFLYIARGSVGEVRSMLLLMERIPSVSIHAEALSLLRGRAANITHQLNAWLDALKSGKKQGPRQKSQQTRRADQASERRDKFLEYIRQVQTEAVNSMNKSKSDKTKPEE